MNPTSFSQILGNDAIKEQLSRMIVKRAIGHALLFAGPDGIGKSLFASALAAQVMTAYSPVRNDANKIASGNHPDIHIYRPEGKLALHSIQSLRELSEEVYLPPFEAEWKVFIIHDADRMLSYSANALLKTFEEPPPRTLIILLSRSSSSLLPTILSRCSAFHFQALPAHLIQHFLKTNYQLDDALFERIVLQSQGSLGRAVQLAGQGDEIRHTILSLLSQGLFVDYTSMQEAVSSIGSQIENAKKNAEDKGKEEFYKTSLESLSAVQQSALEKELEGLTAIAMTREAQALFETILSWYRDLQIINLGGPSYQLMNPDFEEQLGQAMQRGEFRPLNQVCKAVEEAYLALQRSTSLALCLENLFLKLDRI